MRPVSRRTALLSPLAIAVLGASALVPAAMAQQAKPPATLNLKTQNLPAAQLQPGLSAAFFNAYFRDVNNVVKYVAGAQPNKTATLAQINDENGAGMIFNSGRYERYALHIKGYLRFPKAGAWQMQVTSNDGVLIELDGRKAIEDADVHSDRVSDPVTLNVPAAGVVPIVIYYFQNRGSATLILEWTEPGGKEMVTIPASAFWQAKP